MSYSATGLYLSQNNAAGSNVYQYNAGSDTMATVIAAGYFDNDGDTNFVAGDRIYCMCTDGNMWLKVSSVNATTKAVTCIFAGGDLPVRTWATGTAAADNQLSVGYYEVGTSISSASIGQLPTPYAGAEILVRKVDSGTALLHFDAGSGATAITIGPVERRIQLQSENEWFHLKGKSATRWNIIGANHQATAAGEGGSVFFQAT